MKKRIVIAVLVHAFSVHAQQLEKRAARFGDLVVDVSVSEERYVRRLARYFDPEHNPDSIAQAHYDWWKRHGEQDSYSISREIKGAEYPSETEGLVTMETVWHYPDGREILFVIQTQWVRRGQKWYRTSQQQRQLEGRQIN